MALAVLRIAQAFLLLAVPTALAAACARNPTGGTDLVMMSEEDEIALGNEMAREMAGAYPRYRDAELQAKVEEIGHELAALSHRPDITYHFTLVDSPEVNAFALPGGHIYVTRGLLAYLDSEAELAAVLGHEIGHVTARHSVQQHSAQRITAAGVYLGSLAASAFGGGYAGMAASDIGGLFGGALLSGYGRDAELEADRLGAEYLAQAGYDPQALFRVISTLKDQEKFEMAAAAAEGRQPQVYHGLFASHPTHDKRLQEIIENVDDLETKAETLRPENREGFLLSLDGLAYGPSTAQGVVRGRNFYHPALGMAIRFPRDWAVQNEPHRVLSIAPGNEAVLQLTLVPRGRAKTPEELLRYELRVSPDSDEAAFRIRGLPAYMAVARVDTPYGKRETRYVAILVGSQAYVFQGAARDFNRGLDQFDRVFLETAGSLRPLTEREQAATRGPQVLIRRTEEDTTYEGLARNSRIPNYPEDGLRLLNHQYPEGEPEPGSLIKIVK
jgi:predicted Zn-dependent protease